MNTRRITFIVALLLALGSGFLTLRYFQSVAPTAAPKVQLKPVVVADHVIQPHTKITAAMLQITQRPVEQVDPDAISDPKQAEGTLSLISIPEGSIITHSKIGTPAQLGLESVLKPGERAVSIPIDRVKAVAGLIQPGDHVDVLAILPRVNNDIHAYTILRDVRVLALGTTTEDAVTTASPAPNNEAAGTATLAVTPKQAELLAAADLNTTLRLALRSPLEPANSFPTEALRFPDVPKPGQQVAQTGKPAAPKKKDCGPKVLVINGATGSLVCANGE